MDCWCLVLVLPHDWSIFLRWASLIVGHCAVMSRASLHTASLLCSSLAGSKVVLRNSRELWNNSVCWGKCRQALSKLPCHPDLFLQIYSRSKWLKHTSPNLWINSPVFWLIACRLDSALSCLDRFLVPFQCLQLIRGIWLAFLLTWQTLGTDFWPFSRRTAPIRTTWVRMLSKRILLRDTCALQSWIRGFKSWGSLLSPI